jgi:microsomal dipeptidase-like Zn-dependent dipeptidase
MYFRTKHPGRFLLVVKKMMIGVLLVILIGLGALFTFAPRYIDASKNTVTQKNRLRQSKDYSHLPFIADMHCDMLLWDRDFLSSHDYGHVDLPRMQQANIAFQAFSIVSKVPGDLNIEHNESSNDRIGLLSFVQLRPISSWFGIKARALHQCEQLHRFADRSDGQFRVITSKASLKRFIKDRTADPLLTAGMLAIEGAQCLENDLKNLDVFYKKGVRYIGLAHFFDNEWAGSAHGERKEGLTPQGKRLIMKMDSLGIIVDLAHASHQTINDVLRLTVSPVIVSHTGVKGTCNNQRNLSDDHLSEIGRRNGLVAIGLWETAVCGTDAKATARSIKYAADRIGVDKVALGSDFDGTKTHFDITGFPFMMDALKEEGFTSSEIELIMGGNIRNFLLANLPEDN